MNVAAPLTNVVMPACCRAMRLFSAAICLILHSVLMPAHASDGPATATNGIPNVFELKPSFRPNNFRACPPGDCRGGADVESPVFDVAAARLEQAVEQVALSEPRTRKVGRHDASGTVLYEQRTAIFGFPDDIAVAVKALDDARSTLAIDSRSRYGYYDFGVNRGRVERWLDALHAQLADS